MTRRNNTYVIALTTCIMLFSFLFGWLHANIDSYFYWAISEYFRTGTYPYLQPFVYSRPTTMSPPLYGLFFILTQHISHAEILLHGLQLIMLAITSILLYHMLRRHIPQRWAVLVSCAFAVYPVNLIYASGVLTEIPAQLIITIWLFLVLLGTTKRRLAPLMYAFLVSVIGTLLKYNLGVYTVATMVLAVPYRRQLKPKTAIPAVLAVILMGTWIMTNHSITGVWGLSDTHGQQVYNQFVYGAGQLPPENDPSVRRMRSLLPPGTDLFAPVWNLQESLSVSLHGDWTAIDTVFFNVALASIRHHPFRYIIHSLYNFARVHYDHLPYWKSVGNVGITGMSGTDSPYCGSLGRVDMCTPPILTPWSYPVFNAFVAFTNGAFLLFAPVTFFIVLLPSLFITLVSKKSPPFLYACTYLAGVIPIAFLIHPDPRYVVPFYPVGVLCVAAAFQAVGAELKRRKTDNTPQ